MFFNSLLLLRQRCPEQRLHLPDKIFQKYSQPVSGRAVDKFICNLSTRRVSRRARIPGSSRPYENGGRRLQRP